VVGLLPLIPGLGLLRHADEAAGRVEEAGEVTKLLKAGTVVEYGAGPEFVNARILKEMYPEADIVLTETGEAIKLSKRTGAYEEAVQAGAQIVEDYRRLPDIGIRADVSIAIAPQPSQAIEMAETMADVTLPGGRIYIVAQHGESTAKWMADVFSKRYGIEVIPKPMLRSQIPFKSSYLGSQVDVIEFVVP